MRRKVIQIAESTQLVSLPRKWALKYNIKKGDELELEEKGSKILISHEKEMEAKSTEIDVSTLDRTSILYYIEILYRLGYDEIKLKFNNSQAEHYRLSKKENVISVIHYVCSRLIGMEVIQQKVDFALLKSLETTSAKEFDTVIRRIFILLRDATDDFIIAAEKGDFVTLETLEEKHDSIAKFISYGMRILNKKGPGDERYPFLLFHVLNQLDKLMDVIKYSARELIVYNKKLGKDTVVILKKVSTSIKWYIDLFFKFDKSKIRDLYLNRDETIRMIRTKSNTIKPKELIFSEYFNYPAIKYYRFLVLLSPVIY